MDEILKRRIEELLKEHISIVPYDPAWPHMFEKEAGFLWDKLPKDLIRRIEHFGSTAVPGLSAKAIIDVLVEVTSLYEAKKSIVPILEFEGYEYFWRPAKGDDTPPYYAWFIKRDTNGDRSHHIHMAECDSDLWDRLYLRDYLIEFPDQAKQYEILKRKLSEEYHHNRIRYTEEKSNFIISLTQKAKEYYHLR